MRCEKVVLFLLLTAGVVAAQPNAVRPDPRIELFSILFHLAEAPEYNFGKFPSYAAAVAKHFEASRQHPAVLTTRRIRQEHRIGYFHPMNLAVHLTMPPELAERTPFDAAGHGLGTRWPAEQTRGYLEQVRAFYREARVDDFFRQNAPLYESMASKLRELLKAEGDEKWFTKYFGAAPSVGFFVVPAALNGGAQYGPTYRDAKGAEEAFAVIGVYKLDESGRPRFDRSDADNIVHEFAHTLTNKAVTAHLDALKPAGTTLFAPVRDQMRQQGYGEWQTMIYEAVVRAVVVRFVAAHRGDAQAKQEIHEQHKLGFGATGALAELLAEYEKSRAKYPTFSDFMPRVVALFDDQAKNTRSQPQ